MDEKKLKNAVYTTYKVFNERKKDGALQASGALANYMKYRDPNYFTSTNGARQDIIKYIAREELAVYLSRYLLRKATSERPRNHYESLLYQAIQRKKLEHISDRRIISELAYSMLGEEKNFFEQDSDKIAEIACQLFTDEVAYEKEEEAHRIQQEAQKQLESRFGVKNLRINPIAVNYCAQEVLDGTQISIQNDIKNNGNLEGRPARNYNLNDEMFATTDIGEKRKNQEDSVLIMYHPKNPKYKMLLVADGMGGHQDGEKASSQIAQKMYYWFNKLDTQLLSSERIGDLSREWTSQLQEINDEINKMYANAGSTFVGAIVGEENTLVASVGDSRAYFLGKDNELYQITSDDNPAYQVWKRRWGQPEARLTPQMLDAKKVEKDLLRFRKDSNRIHSAIGVGQYDVRPHYISVPNDQYSTLMLFSDGVTDCLSDTQIKAITQRTDYKKLSQMLVAEAIQQDSYIPRQYRNDGDYNPVIQGGKDNATVAVLKNKQGDER